MSTPPSYGVSAADVTPSLPIDTTALPSNGGRLSVADLDTYITAAGAELRGYLEAAGHDPSNLDGAALLQVQKAIVHYAVAEALAKLGHSGPAYTQARLKWEREVERWSKAPQSVASAPGVTMTNIPEDAPASPWTSRGFKF